MYHLLSHCLPQFNHCPPFSLWELSETLPPSPWQLPAPPTTAAPHWALSVLWLLPLSFPISFLFSDHCSPAHVSKCPCVCPLNAIVLQGASTFPCICTPAPCPVIWRITRAPTLSPVPNLDLQPPLLRARGWHFHLCAWHFPKGKVNHRSNTEER